MKNSKILLKVIAIVVLFVILAINGTIRLCLSGHLWSGIGNMVIVAMAMAYLCQAIKDIIEGR